ncbi:hypothetical protein NL676_028848 [Syzygium grande]|nr:hypothetical protein NL676_028848 [Syzygium grande]
MRNAFLDVNDTVVESIQGRAESEGSGDLHRSSSAATILLCPPLELSHMTMASRIQNEHAENSRRSGRVGDVPGRHWETVRTCDEVKEPQPSSGWSWVGVLVLKLPKLARDNDD